MADIAAALWKQISKCLTGLGWCKKKVVRGKKSEGRKKQNADDE